MECMRTIDMTIDASLSLPLVDVLVLANLVFGVDLTGAMQSIIHATGRRRERLNRIAKMAML